MNDKPINPELYEMYDEEGAAMTRYEAIEKALDNLLIGIGMGWDLDDMVNVARAALALPEDSKVVNVEQCKSIEVKHSWPEWLWIESLPKIGPVLIVHEKDNGDRWCMEWEASRYHAEMLKESQHNFPPHLTWAKAIAWMPSPPLPGETILVCCNTCGHPK